VEGSKSWREVRSQLALNEARADTYRRLMDAQLRIAESLLRRGVVTEEQVDAAISASQAEASGPEEDQIYLSALARYVAALGGHLEIQAVFQDEAITVMHADFSDATTPREPRSGGQIPGSEAS